MSAKDTKSDVFSYLWKAQSEFLSRSHTVSSNKRLSYTSFYLC